MDRDSRTTYDRFTTPNPRHYCYDRVIVNSHRSSPSQNLPILLYIIMLATQPAVKCYWFLTQEIVISAEFRPQPLPRWRHPSLDEFVLPMQLLSLSSRHCLPLFG